MSNILITGANGFIGKNLAAHLENNDSNNVIRLCGNNYPQERYPFVFSGDITNPDTFDRLPACDTVIHLAAVTSYEYISANKFETSRVYLSGILNLIEYAKRAKTKKIIFVSSCKVYGNSPMPYSEENECMPTTLMGELKCSVENTLSLYEKISGTDVIILRTSNVYGPMQSDRFLVPKLFDSCLNSTPLTLCDAGTIRNYIYIDDLISAIDIALKPEMKGCRIYNVAAQNSISIGEIVSTVEKVTGKKANYTVSYVIRKDETAAETVNSEKIRALGWKETVGFEEGIKKIYQY